MIIALGHTKQVGKNLFFELLAKNYPNAKLQQVAFADGIREEVFESVLRPHGIPYSILENGDRELTRPITKAWGEIKRNLIGQDYWINKLANKVSPNINNGTFTFITDLRLSPELDWVKSMGGIYVKITRVPLPFQEEDMHITERDLLDVTPDYEILNDGTIPQYEKKVIDFFEHVILGGK